MIAKPQQNNLSQQPQPIFATAKKQQELNPKDNQTTSPRHQLDHIPQPSLQPSLPTRMDLQKLYEDFMGRSEYSKAENTKHAIDHLVARQKKKKIRNLSQEFYKQKQSIKKSRKQEIEQFHQLWCAVFKRQSTYEDNLMQKMKKIKEEDQRTCKLRIIRRCQSAKPLLTLKKLCQIESTERSLRVLGQTPELRKLRSQKKMIINQCHREQQRNFERIAQQEQKRMAQRQTRRYRSFMHRIEASRIQKQCYFKREEYRLEQKYKNILKNLQHEQKLAFIKF